MRVTFSLMCFHVGFFAGTRPFATPFSHPFYRACDAASSIGAATSLGLETYTAWLAPETSTLWLFFVCLLLEELYRVEHSLWGNGPRE